MKSYVCGVIPDEWKNSNIVPIPKSSNEAQATNYRPINNCYFHPNLDNQCHPILDDINCNFFALYC